MNRLTQELARICGQRLLDPKWLIAPSLRIGQQWLIAVARQGQPLINVQVKTLRGLTLELAGPRLADQGLELVPDTRSRLIIDRIWARMRAEAAYLGPLPAGQSLAQALHQTLSAIRLAGLEAQDLKAGRFEAPAKGRELAALLAVWPAELAREGLIDYAGALALALDRLAEEPAALGPDIILLRGEDLEPTYLEERLWESLPRNQRLELPVDPPAQAPLQAEACDLFWAVGETNEVRQVLRRCLTEGWALDQVEVLYTETAAYLPLIYETARRLWPEEAGLSPHLPVTFAEGVPCGYFRPGRALAAWVAWIRDGLPGAGLAEMVSQGLLKSPGVEAGQTTWADLSARLRRLGLGPGLSRYLGSIESRLGRASGQERAELEAARALVTDLVAVSPDIIDPPRRILEGARAFLEKAAQSASEEDNYARKSLIEEIGELAAWLEAGQEIGLDVWEWLAARPEETRVGGSGPRPGCLHAAPALAGGHSGRERTFIIGLNERSFPSALLQDPLLLDGERRRLSPHLPTAAREMDQRELRFGWLLGRLRGRVSLGYSGRDLAAGEELFPSPVFLDAYRKLAGQPTAGRDQLVQDLPPPTSFAPERPEECLTEAEWWLWRLLASPEGRVETDDPACLLGDAFPHLSQGLAASKSRAEAAFSPFDGRLADLDPQDDPLAEGGPVMSTQRLEQLGRCPLGYFFRYLLQLALPDGARTRPDLWLQPAQAGQLLHQAFHRFMSRLKDEDRPPVTTWDESGLMEVVEGLVAEWLEQVPPPSQAAFLAQREEFIQTARIFLAEEALFSRQSRPLFLEVSVGLAQAGQEGESDDPEPVTISLPNHRKIRTCGRLDRIDQSRAGGRSFAVWDYKTGSASRFDAPDPFNQGRIIQPWLYLVLAEAFLQRRLHPQAKVASSGLFFPGLRHRGRRLSWTPKQLAAGREIVGWLVDLVSTRAFAPSDDLKQDCGICDFKSICDLSQEAAKEKQAMLSGPDTELLEPLRRLRGLADED